MEKLGGRKLDRQLDLGFELLLECVGSKKAELGQQGNCSADG